MDNASRMKEGDTVEITDRASPYFGKTGRLMKIVRVHITMIDSASRPTSQREEYRCEVKLEDTETTEQLSLSQITRIP